MNYLLLVRHGESRWNSANKFTGWVDVPLSSHGIDQALHLAERVNHLDIDFAFTSDLVRAQETLLIILTQQDRTGIFLHRRHPDPRARFSDRIQRGEIPIRGNKALNERFYGKLQGMKKDAAARRWGAKKVLAWRRSYATRPPGGESLKDVEARVVPYFRTQIMPEVRKGKNVIVAAHGNSLRALIKRLEGISDEAIAHLELEPCRPVIYGHARGRLVRLTADHTFDRPLRRVRRAHRARRFRGARR